MKQSVRTQREHDSKTSNHVVAQEFTIDTSIETDPLSDFLSTNLEARLPTHSRRAKSKLAQINTHTNGFNIDRPLTKESFDLASQPFLN